MRIGIFGDGEDAQTEQVSAILQERGAEVLLLERDALDRGLPHSSDGCSWRYRGEDLGDIGSYWVRYIQSPLAPYVEEEEGVLGLHEEWFVRYMQQRERESYVVSWLLSLEAQGASLINAPVAGQVSQLKPYQLSTFVRHGLPCPRTCITNDPAEVRAFWQQVGSVVFKPVMGGGLCQQLGAKEEERLPLLAASPVIFQEEIVGEDVRVVVLDGEILSAVVVELSEEVVDFRADPAYARGEATYRECPLPPAIEEVCRRAARVCGLRLTGIDLKRCSKERYVLLECNSSPIYLDVERKMGHAISEKLAQALLAEGSRRSCRR